MSAANDHSKYINFNELNMTDMISSDFVNDTRPDMTSTDILTEQLAYVLNVYFTPVLIIMGTIGNFLSIIVFYKSKLRSLSTSQYLSALAVSDIIFLLQLIPPWLKTVRVSRVFDREGFCQCFVYLTYVSSSSSAWLVVAFTVERFVAVLYPLRRNRMCTVRRARLLILTIVISSLAINAPVLKFAVPKSNDCNIDYELMDHAARFNVVDTIFSFTLPLTIITVLNIWITIGVCKLSRARGDLFKEDEIPPRRQNSSCSSQQRITKMLLSVSSVFVLLNLPAYTMRIVAYTNNMSSYEYIGKWAALQQICLLFFQCNFGINFFLYCMTGQNFRRALCDMMTCAWSTVKQRCCAPPDLAPQPRPRPSVTTDSLSINTEASTNAATSRVNYHQDNKEEVPTISGSSLMLSRQERVCTPDNLCYELQSVNTLPAVRLSDSQLRRPVPRWSNNFSDTILSRPTQNTHFTNEIAHQMFKPIPYILVPGQIAPLVDSLSPSPRPANLETTSSLSVLPLASTAMSSGCFLGSCSAPLSILTPLGSASLSELSQPLEDVISLFSQPQSPFSPVLFTSLSESALDSRLSSDLFESYMWMTNRYPLQHAGVQPSRRFSLPARQSPLGWAHLQRESTPQALESPRARLSPQVPTPTPACS